MIWAVLLVFFAGVLLWAARLTYRLVFYNRNSREQDVYVVPPGEQYEKVADVMLQGIYELDQLPFEQIYITARDGVRLAARYYHNKDNAPVQIMFHGYRSNNVREYSCGFKIAAELGYNSIVVDERAHGKSGGHTITFGIKERYDCLDWALYARRRFGPEIPVFLSGVSMGAATVLMASELDLPDNVAAITADSPYASPSAIIRKVCRDMKLPDRMLFPIVVLGAFLYGHFNLLGSSAVKAVCKAKVPILLIHGEDDRLVPCAMSRKIYDTCKSVVRLTTFPTAGHGLSYLVDPQRYKSEFKSFLLSCGLTQ